jgi:hypothetical protein
MIKRYEPMKEIHQSSQQNPVSAHCTGTPMKIDTTPPKLTVKNPPSLTLDHEDYDK